MRAEPWRGAALAACALAAGCGTIQPEVTYPNGPSREAATHAPAASLPATALGGKWDATLDGLRAQDQRVADIAYRLASANAALCPDHAPLTGLLLHSALQYSPRLRPDAEATFHIDDRPAVEAVAAAGPAAAAGLQVGDILLAVDERPLPRTGGGVDAPATYQPVQQALTTLESALQKGEAELTVQRGARQVRVTLTPRDGCAYDAQVTPGPELNASADGRHVFVTTGFASYVRSDDMLALVLGHEYAHDLLHHHDRLDRQGFARNVLGELGSNPASLIIAEKEADYVGLYLTARAGYDISAAPDFWRRFPQAIGDFGWSHPGNWERAASLAATRDEILAKQRRGQPLIPNPAGGTSSAH